MQYTFKYETKADGSNRNERVIESLIQTILSNGIHSEIKQVICYVRNRSLLKIIIIRIIFTLYCDYP